MIATGVVAAALIAALVTIGLVTRARLIAAVEDKAGSRAEAVAGLVEAGAAHDPLPGRNPELLAQVVSPSGEVIAADHGAAGLPPFAAATPPAGETALLRVPAPEGIRDDEGLPEDGTWLVAARGTDGGEVVLVAAPLDDAGEVFGAAVGVVATAVGAVLLVAAGATWLLTGLALRPVERMRAEAAQISEGALDRRIDVPGTGDELARLAATLNEMLQRLEEASVTRRRFVADASHELRSPVAAMRAMIDVTNGTAPDDGLLRALDDEVERLERVVADLLALARSDRAPASRLSEIDLDQVLRAEAAAMRRRSPLRIDTSEVQAARVIADPEAMARLSRNLCDNALRHATTGVWLTSIVRDGLAVIGVDDDGPGVELEDRELAFERFVRLDAARDRASGGTGLGLSLVRALARGAGGEARFVASRRGGASVEVTLPAAGP
jgi:signal transduction histidine kinase